MSAPVDESTIRTQRRAADPARSAWVSANAGAGKTRVLTERVARLLLSGVEPGRILCLTFTKAAAAEMLHRLFAMLAEWAVLSREELGEALTRLTGARPDTVQMNRARVLFARTLDSPGGLRIQTIHSFCQDLLARFPLEAGVAPASEVQDERTAAELLQSARDQVFRRLMEDENQASTLAGDLTGHFSQTALMEFLAEITTRRGRFRDIQTKAGGLDALLAAIRLRLGAKQGTTPNSLIAAAVRDDALALGDRRRAAAILAQGSKTEQQAADAMHGFLGTDDRVVHYPRYRGAFFTQTGKPRARLLNTGTAAAHPDVAATLDTEQARLAALEEACRSARMARMTEIALGFADAYFDTYEALKHARGTLDYEDLILKARELLSHAPSAAWVLFKLDQSIDHVLVDEAQDTSPEQWDVITRLTEDFFAGRGAETSHPRTVFAVGDEKQSIYGFQGAAPELFQETAHRMGVQAESAHLPWSAEILDLSFRSLPAILEAVDLVFARPEASEGLKFDESPIKHRAWRGEGRGLVEIWPVCKPDKIDERPAWDAPLDRPPGNDPKALLAARIANTVKRWFEDGESVYSGETDSALRPMRPGDILILVRRRDRLVDEMIRAFRERNIPVAGTDRLSLIDHIAVMDLMAAAEAALLPEDDLTIATLLKSPLCGLDDEALFCLAYNREGNLIEALRGAVGTSSEISRACDVADWLVDHRDLRPFDFFSRLLTEESGRANLLARLGPDAADPIEEFLNQALAFERTHTPTLQGFVHWLHSAAVDVKRDMDQRADEIRIMTVHGAKGLQSNVVILPDTCTSPNARHDPSLLPLPAEADGPELIVMAPAKADDCAASAEARAAWARKRDAEFRRLLYVALTRARDRLYICGYETASTARPDDCWYELVHGALAGEALEVKDPLGDSVLQLGEAPPALGGGHMGIRPQAITLPRWTTRPPSRVETPSKRLSPSSLAIRETAEHRGAAFTVSADKAAARGNLIHRMLELLPAMPPGEHEAAARRFLESRAGDLPSDERAELSRETLRVLADSKFAPVFGAGSMAEVSVMGTLPDLGPDFVIDGRIDRLVVTEARILAVDFKTGVPPVSVDAVPEDYLTQMAAYGALLRRIYPGRHVSCALLWTRVPAFMELESGAMDRALRRAAEGQAAP